MIIGTTLGILLALLLLSIPVAATLTILGLSLGEIFARAWLFRELGREG